MRLVISRRRPDVKGMLGGHLPVQDGAPMVYRKVAAVAVEPAGVGSCTEHGVAGAVPPQRLLQT